MHVVISTYREIQGSVYSCWEPSPSSQTCFSALLDVKTSKGVGIFLLYFLANQLLTIVLNSGKAADRESSNAFHKSGIHSPYDCLLQKCFEVALCERPQTHGSGRSHSFRHECLLEFGEKSVARRDGKTLPGRAVAGQKCVHLLRIAYHHTVWIVSDFEKEYSRESSMCTCGRYLWRYASSPISAVDRKSVV